MKIEHVQLHYSIIKSTENYNQINNAIALYKKMNVYIHTDKQNT